MVGDSVLLAVQQPLLCGAAPVSQTSPAQCKSPSPPQRAGQLLNRHLSSICWFPSVAYTPGQGSMKEDAKGNRHEEKPQSLSLVGRLAGSVQVR